MEAQPLSVREVAERLGLSQNTVRRYADGLAHSLSEGARSRPRTFTAEDVERLHTASQLRASTVGLGAPTLPSWELPASSVAAPPPSTASLQPQAAPLWTSAMVDDLYGRLRALEAAQRTLLAVGVLAGAAVGMGLCLFLLALAWLLVNGAAL